ncbi:ankyrin repeat domain-containing protein 50-like [Montipora capricornis]|uniref:ankyrin repeat domain-containing protein 50-like n=1 Tax=Montipora capricornis TaxID=246305 RepID=UPI0035F17064
MVGTMEVFVSWVCLACLVLRYSGCPLEFGDVPFDTKEFNFTSHLNSARDGFTGRLWLYRDLERLLLSSEGDSVAGVVVVGEPGAGKSAISAELICSRSSNPYIHKIILGYHLCKYSDKATQDPGRFRSCLRDPFDCFEQAVVIPLHQLKSEIRDYFIVIDALDECKCDDSGTSIVHLITNSKKRLPKWIHLVVTTRKDSRVLKNFSSFPKLHLSSTDSRNLQDIEIFITSKTSDEVSYLTSMLLRQSQGNFLFAKEMLNFLKKDPSAVDLTKLPKTIGEHYESYLRRAFGSRVKFKAALAMLEVLVASYEPLKLNHLLDVLQTREAIDYEYDFIYILEALSQFITYGEDNTITLFHLSFIEWLTSKENLGNPYYVSRSRGHSRLAEYYLTESLNASYVNATIDSENRTLLHLAANKSDTKVLQLLRPAFQNIDCEDNYGFTPAFTAAMNGLSQNVDFLLRQGARIEHRTKPPPSSNFEWVDSIKKSKTVFWNSTMMHAAAANGHSEVVRLLLKKNASFAGVNAVNLTAIQLAAENGHLKVVQLLYERGAKLDHLSLQHAAFGGHTDIVKFLQHIGVVDRCMRCDGSFYWLENQTRYQTAPLNSVSYILSDDRFKIFCQSALHLAVAKNHTKVANLLLLQDDSTIHCTDFTGRTPLHEAVRQNHVAIVELLIKHGARISRKCTFFQNLSIFDNFQKRSGHYLSEGRIGIRKRSLPLSFDSVFTFCKNNKDIKPLLGKGARIDVTDEYGMTPLHYSVLNAVEGKGAVMFKAKINPDTYLIMDILVWTSEGDITVARDACIFQRNVPLNVQCLKLLVVTESTDAFLINKVDNYGRTALHLAAQSGDECYTTELL